MSGTVVGVHTSPVHKFSKRTDLFITLIAGLGVAGDAHAGKTVRHRSRVSVDPDQPNLRQVHLIASELIDEINSEGFDLAFGALGENITTRGIDLINLPRGTLLYLGDEAVISVTGLRNPCSQIEKFRKGLLKRMIGRHEDGSPLLLTGIMSIVLKGGTVRQGDPIRVELPDGPHYRLEKV
jgi:MOSC domain-containing protein YiiM